MNVVRSCVQDDITQFERTGQLQALGDNINADYLLDAQLTGQCRCCQSHGSQSGDQYGVVAVELNLLNRFVYGPKAARDLSPICVGELAWQRDEILLFRDHVVGHSAVTLPAVRSPVFLICAGNHVTAATVIANAAPRDVIHDHAVADFKAPATLSHLDDFAAWLMAGDNSLVTFGSLAEMLVINAADIGTADRGGLNPDQNFAVVRARNRNRAKFDSVVSRKKRGSHILSHRIHAGFQPHCSRWRYLTSWIPEIFPGLTFFPKKYLALNQSAIAVDRADR